MSFRKYPASLANDFAWATECNLATLNDILSRKSTSKARIDRQVSICKHLMLVVSEHEAEISWSDSPNAWGRHYFGRTEVLLAEIKGHGADAAFNAYVERLQDIYRPTTK